MSAVMNHPADDKPVAEHPQNSLNGITSKLRYKVIYFPSNWRLVSSFFFLLQIFCEGDGNLQMPFPIQ